MLTASNGKTSSLQAVTPSDTDFSNVLSTQSLSSNSFEHQNALNHFYDLHQRSQITGVSTTEYNDAIKALGLDPSKGPFAAIDLLREAGYDTSSPSIKAILNYGSSSQKHGNQTYLAQPSDSSSLVKTSRKSDLVEESIAEQATPIKLSETLVGISELSKTTVTQGATTEMSATNSLPKAMAMDISMGAEEEMDVLTRYSEFLEGATNYFEAATVVSNKVDMQSYSHLTLQKALPLILDKLSLSSSFSTTQQWLSQSNG